MLLIELSSTVLPITYQIVVFTLSVHLDTFKSQDLIACCSWAPQDSCRDAGPTHQPHQRKIRYVFFQKRAIDMQTAVTIFVVSFFVGTTLVLDLPVIPIDTVRDLCEPPTHVCSDFNWHRVWYVLELVPITCRRSLITGNIQTYPPSSSSFGTRTAIRGHSSFRR